MSTVASAGAIDLRILCGETLAVCGTVGSGKSSLLAALLGQMPALGAGSVMVAGRVAYVPQSAWIQNASLRDNILFGRPFDPAAYRTALRTCAPPHPIRHSASGANSNW